jgi:hypothetical protein
MTAAGLFCFIELRSATLLVSEPNLSDPRKFQGLGRSAAHRSPAIVQRVSRALTLDTNWGHADRWRRTFSPEDLQPEDPREAYATDELVAELDSPSNGARPGRALVRFGPDKIEVWHGRPQ